MNGDGFADVIVGPRVYLGGTAQSTGASMTLDNIDDPLGGSVLCSVLTQQSVKVRILGLSVNADLPTKRCRVRI